MANRNENMLIWIGAMVQNGDRFLFLRRSGHTNWGHKWQLPGGRMEGGEAPIETMEREVMEETGLRVRNPKLAGTYTSMLKSSKGTHYHTLLVIFHVKTRKIRVKLSHEHDEFAWMTPTEALKADLFKDLGRFVRGFSKKK